MTRSPLATLAAEVAATTPGAVGRTEGHTTIWSAAGKPFAALSGDSIEFRLDAVVGPAARRTPGAISSTRGDDWVAFRPSDLDQYAEDRVRAWFAAAHRRATV